MNPQVRVFYEVGSLEPFLLEENREFAAALRTTLGSRAHARKYPGGHDYMCWRRSIIDALRWFNTALERDSIFLSPYEGIASPKSH
nr:hypothetical protein [Corynebacterium macginleyi]